MNLHTNTHTHCYNGNFSGKPRIAICPLTFLFNAATLLISTFQHKTIMQYYYGNAQYNLQ